jgi:nitrile hydratase
MSSRNETVGQIIARAWSDPEFAQRLLADTHAALAELGIAIPLEKSVVAIENNAALTYIVLPSLRYTETKSAYADIKAFGESYRDPRLSPLDWASRDPVFTERLKADPKAALRDMGMEVTEAMSVEIVQNTTTQAYLVLPARPEEAELSPEVLQRVSDGWIPPAVRYVALEHPMRLHQFLGA